MAKDLTVKYFKPTGLSGLELLTCLDGNFLFPPHFHDDYCIWLNCSGGEYYTHRGNTYVLQPDNLGIIAPGEVHANQACDQASRSLITFYLNPERLRQVGEQISERHAFCAEFASDSYLDSEALERLVILQHLLSESNSALERESAFLETVALLIEHHGVERLQRSAVGAEADRVALIVDFLRSDPGHDFTLEELAMMCDCTPFHLIRFFKKATGLSPHAYLVQLRLEQAKYLLGQGQQIVDVALDLGFSDQSHLTRAFKTRFGLPPGTYQRQIITQ